MIKPAAAAAAVCPQWWSRPVHCVCVCVDEPGGHFGNAPRIDRSQSWCERNIFPFSASPYLALALLICLGLGWHPCRAARAQHQRYRDRERKTLNITGGHNHPRNKTQIALTLPRSNHLRGGGNPKGTGLVLEHHFSCTSDAIESICERDLLSPCISLSFSWNAAANGVI